MSSIVIELPTKDWVWLCEFLSTVLREGELDSYTREDIEHIYQLLRAAEKGEAKL